MEDNLNEGGFDGCWNEEGGVILEEALVPEEPAEGIDLIEGGDGRAVNNEEVRMNGRNLEGEAAAGGEGRQIEEGLIRRKMEEQVSPPDVSASSEGGEAEAIDENVLVELNEDNVSLEKVSISHIEGDNFTFMSWIRFTWSGITWSAVTRSAVTWSGIT